MSKRHIEQELDSIKKILKQFPCGACVEEIEQEAIRLGLRWTRRTLQRRLSKVAKRASS